MIQINRRKEIITEDVIREHKLLEILGIICENKNNLTHKLRTNNNDIVELVEKNNKQNQSLEYALIGELIDYVTLKFREELAAVNADQSRYYISEVKHYKKNFKNIEWKINPDYDR